MTQTLTDPLVIAPGAYPLVGHLPQFLHDRLAFLAKCAKMPAAVVRIRLDTDAYLLLDADDIKHVLESNHANYDKTPRLTSQRGKALSGYGLLTSSGREHLEKRRALQPVFAASSFMPLATRVVEETIRFLSDWRDGQEIDAATQMMDLAQRINGQILFSADYTGADAALGEAIRARRRYMTRVFGSILPFYEHLKIPPQICLFPLRRRPENLHRPGTGQNSNAVDHRNPRPAVPNDAGIRAGSRPRSTEVRQRDLECRR